MMSRLIDAEPLDCLAWKDGEHGTTFDDGVLWVQEKIAEQPTIEPQRWIPCSERLPEDGERVLVTVKNGKVLFGSHLGKYWAFGSKVVAWMPLPEPYKEAET